MLRHSGNHTGYVERLNKLGLADSICLLLPNSRDSAKKGVVIHGNPLWLQDC